MGEAGHRAVVARVARITAAGRDAPGIEAEVRERQPGAGRIALDVVAAGGVVIVKAVSSRRSAHGERIAEIDRAQQPSRRAYLKVVRPEHAAGATQANRVVRVVEVSAAGERREVEVRLEHAIHVDAKSIVGLVEVDGVVVPVAVSHAGLHARRSFRRTIEDADAAGGFSEEHRDAAGAEDGGARAGHRTDVEPVAGNNGIDGHHVALAQAVSDAEISTAALGHAARRAGVAAVAGIAAAGRPLAGVETEVRERRPGRIRIALSGLDVVAARTVVVVEAVSPSRRAHSEGVFIVDEADQSACRIDGRGRRRIESGVRDGDRCGNHGGAEIVDGHRRVGDAAWVAIADTQVVGRCRNRSNERRATEELHGGNRAIVRRRRGEGDVRWYDKVRPVERRRDGDGGSRILRICQGQAILRTEIHRHALAVRVAEGVSVNEHFREVHAGAAVVRSADFAANANGVSLVNRAGRHGG